MYVIYAYEQQWIHFTTLYDLVWNSPWSYTGNGTCTWIPIGTFVWIGLNLVWIRMCLTIVWTSHCKSSESKFRLEYDLTGCLNAILGELCYVTWRKYSALSTLIGKLFVCDDTRYIYEWTTEFSGLIFEKLGSVMFSIMSCKIISLHSYFYILFHVIICNPNICNDM